MDHIPLVTLDAARDRAIDMRRAAREGRDLAQERRQQVARATTFRQAFDVMFDLRQQGLSNAKHLKQWPATMETYVFPRIGSRPVGDVTHADILEVLEPIWYEKPETAKRVLQRIEAVFKSAILRGQRDKASPCIGVAQELGVTPPRRRAPSGTSLRGGAGLHQTAACLPVASRSRSSLSSG